MIEWGIWGRVTLLSKIDIRLGSHTIIVIRSKLSSDGRISSRLSLSLLMHTGVGAPDGFLRHFDRRFRLLLIHASFRLPINVHTESRMYGSHECIRYIEQKH